MPKTLNSLLFIKDTEETASNPFQIDHAERDSPDQITLYAPPDEKGNVWYWVLNQELIDLIKSL